MKILWGQVKPGLAHRWSVITVQTCLVISIFCFTYSITGCGQKKKKGDISYTVETAKMVSHAPSGLISKGDKIQIHFVAPMVKENLVGQKLQKSVFSFQPSIDGITTWADPQTLIFQPRSVLPLRQEYIGTLNMSALFPQHKKEKLENLDFQFEVAGIEIESFNADFDLAKENDPHYLVLKGELKFTESVDLKAVKKSSSLQMNSKKLDLLWQTGENGKSFNFTSSSILRDKSEKKIVFKIKKNVADISSDFEKEFFLAPFEEMRVVEVIRLQDGSRPQLQIHFTDELAKEQDVTGLFSTEPALDLKHDIIEKTLVINGPFEHGEDYTFIVQPGIRSRWGTKTETSFSQDIHFEDFKPQIRFASDGVFLTTNHQHKVNFMTLNLSRVQLQIKKVFESNVGQFLQTERLDSKRDRREQFVDSYVNRVGLNIITDTLDIGGERNKWLQHELDLTNIIKPEEKGLFLLSLNFEQDDMLYGTEEERENWSKRPIRYGQDYYSNPFSPGYIYQHGRVYKPIILSDIGLTWKKAYQQHTIYATDIIRAEPLSGVKITLLTFQNQIIAQKETNSEGRVEFQDIDQDVFYIKGEKGEQKSVIKANEMEWNLSTFDTGGEKEKVGGTKVFIYTERGVYRPGDEINISIIARNEENTFPKNHPVTVKIYNPRNQMVQNQTLSQSVDGFYHLNFETQTEDPTGNWRVQVLAGSQTFDHTLKIETIVPFRLKVKIESEKKKLLWQDRLLKLDLTSTYLFGNPASGLEANVEVNLQSDLKSFPAYKTYSFNNEFTDFKPVQTTIFSGKLDAAGKAQILWSLPLLEKAPSGLQALLTAKVLEKGGRPNQTRMAVPIDPFPYYVGMEKPHFKYNYAQVGTSLNIPVILVDPQGKPKAGRTLSYKIHKNSHYWWWEYENRNEFRLRFKSDRNTTVVKEGTLLSQNSPTNLAFSPQDRGEYLIEVQDEAEKGHSAAFFLSAYPWGGGPGGGQEASTLTLRTDKETYLPGDVAEINFPAPKEGVILFSMEKGQHLLSSKFYRPESKDTEMTLKVPVTKEMVPTCYAAISVIQPHDQTLNDRPIRLYGVIPINVDDPSTRQELKITMPDELQSDSPFKVELATTDKKPTQFTIAVVDEGLLDLTRFKTPDPWHAFYKKLFLGVKTFDLFSYVIGANKGDIFKTFSIGGGMELYRDSQLEPDHKKRFKPVSMFKGPLQTDSNGFAKIEFDMPNYIGSVRIMAVAAKGNRYTHAEKTVPVKTDLIVLPTLSRVLGPEDKISVPVTIFAMKENTGDVEVTLTTEGPLSVTGSGKEIINFTDIGEKDMLFELTTNAAIGTGKITITAESRNSTSTYETDIDIRPSSPRIYESQVKDIQPGNNISFTIPNRGIKGSNHARLSVQRRPNLDFTHRLMWLIRYPYGCIEQTVSAVFPQLYLKDLLKGTNEKGYTDKEIDENINAGIRQLRRYQLPSGSFSYWPGGGQTSVWGSSYAGHFLIKARNLGYHVPQDLLSKWLRYEKSQALTTKDNLMERVYRVYLLSLAGEPQTGAMNLLKENSLKDMNDTQKWMLAAAYQLAGVNRTASSLLRNVGQKVTDYNEFGGTYGSGMRDKAIILDMSLLFERLDDAKTLTDELAQVLSTRDWYSTQTTGYMLLAIGKYIKKIEGDQDSPLLSGSISLPGGEKRTFSTNEISFHQDIESGFGESIEVQLDNKSTVNRAYITLAWDGIPLKSDVTDESKNLTLSVNWLDEDGMPTDPSLLTQGATFWGHFQVSKPGFSQRIDEVALTQVLPAGWEIENIRLSQEQMPPWMSKWRLNRQEFLDIRDDRIMWFFDLPGRYRDRDETLDFVVKLNAVTVGEFFLPATLLEAMYNNNFKATKAGKKVIVKAR